MIHYELRCQAGHGFDGWFANSGAFEQQARRAQIVCPVCSGTEVERALMAPRLARGGRRPVIEEGAAPPEAKGTQVAAPEPASDPTAGQRPMPDEMRALLQRLRSEVEQKCTYVGSGFADAARRMHEGEQEARPIYGEATPDEAVALQEDGIGIARIPWVPRADS